MDEESLVDHEDMGIFATFCQVSKEQHVSCETMEMSSVSQIVSGNVGKKAI